MSQLSKIRIIERKKISDHRGWFLKAIDGHEEGLPAHTGEVYFTCGTGGQAKGGHYHPKAQEWFTLITGNAILKLQDVQTNEFREITMNSDTPTMIYIPPMVAHLVINSSPQEEFILCAYTDLLYDPADTIRHSFNNESMILLSICIPTYNRQDKLIALVQKLLDRSLSNIEIVVLDNRSTDKTKSMLASITDGRFRYVEQPFALTGISNIAAAINSGRGKYTLLCLDKDYINVEWLGQFIDFLTANPDLAYGQCSLNATEMSEHKFYWPGIEALMDLGYNCHHPTGFFVCNEKLRQTDIVSRILTNNNNFAFNTDLVKAHLVMQGKGAYVNFPLMATETLTEAAKERSHTYSGDNIWFFSKNITVRMQLFIEDALTLGLSDNELKLIINRIYSANIGSVTVGLKKNLQNEAICAHHGIETRKVGYGEMWQNLHQFQCRFLKLIIPISRTTKCKIVLVNLLKLSARILLKK